MELLLLFVGVNIVTMIAYVIGRKTGARQEAMKIRTIVYDCTSRGKGTNGLIKASFLYQQLTK